MNKLSLSGIFLNDWPRKVSAIVLAILIYSIIRIQLQQERTFDHVRVNIVPDNPKMVVLDDEPVYVSVTLEGTKRAINRLKSNQQIQITHKVDALAEPGPYTCLLSENDIKLPPGVKLADTNPFSPGRIEVEVDRVIEKSVDVRVIINRDTIPDGWGIDKSTSKPSRVKIRGPRKLLEKRNYVRTDDIEIVKRLDKPESFKQSVRLANLNDKLSVIPIAVEVSIDFKQNTVIQPFRDIPVKVMRRSNNELEVLDYIDVPKVSFSVQGEGNDMELLDAGSFEAFIILDDTVGEGETIRTINIWFDRQNRESCTITGKNPESLRVVIGQKKN